MTIDINVKDAWEDAQKFENSEDNIVNVAEPRGLSLFGMM